MPFAVKVEGFDQPFGCKGDQKVLIAMERAGQAQIPVGCRGGGCGACKVLVLSGNYRTLRMSREKISAEEEGDGYALACRLLPDSDLELRSVGKIFDK